MASSPAAGRRGVGVGVAAGPPPPVRLGRPSPAVEGSPADGDDGGRPDRTYRSELICDLNEHPPLVVRSVLEIPRDVVGTTGTLVGSLAASPEDLTDYLEDIYASLPHRLRSGGLLVGGAAGGGRQQGGGGGGGEEEEEDEGGVYQGSGGNRMSVYSTLPACQSSVLALDKNQLYLVVQINLKKSKK